MRGPLNTFAKNFRQRALLALQQLPLEDDSLLLCGLAEENLVRVSSRAVEVVGVNRRRVGLLPRGEHIAGILPTSAVDPVAVNVEQSPTLRKHDRTL